MTPPGQMVWDRSHTGKRSLLIPAGSQRIAVKLSSVLSGRQFPGEWTLVGAFLYCDQPIEITIGLEGGTANISPRRVQLTGESWSIALADLTNLVRSDTANISDNTKLLITLPRNAPPVWCDDVLLINNARAIVSAPTSSPSAATAAIAATATADISEEYTATRVGNSPPVVTPTPLTNDTSSGVRSNAPLAADPGPGWSIQERGLSYIGERPGKFNFKLLTADASRSGWKIEEANPIRARFTSTGSTKNLTVYSDGRSYKDGVFEPVSAQVRDDPGCTEPNTSPPAIEVNPELGRVNRNTAGDANNDGYNETRGAHQLVASGARMEMTIIPHTSFATRPVFEIAGLPEGNVLVTIEGRLVEQPGVRLPDGSLLIELPVRIDRPTSVNLRLQ
jgi:hypothetical protein